METYINAFDYYRWYAEESKFLMTIRSKVPNEKYKENYDKIFGKKSKPKEEKKSKSN